MYCWLPNMVNGKYDVQKFGLKMQPTILLQN
jgi:hypothetical protein